MVKQQIIKLTAKKRGVYLITKELQEKCSLSADCEQGIAHLFLLHTSCGLSLNENSDPAVLSDLNRFIDHLAPEGFPDFQHIYEGSDDMPAHVKSALFGVSISVPVRQGKFLLGTWQGIYFLEFRNRATARKLAITLIN